MVRDVQVTVNIRHPRLSDLLVELGVPNGLRVPCTPVRAAISQTCVRSIPHKNCLPLQMLLCAKTERQALWKLLV